jgi:hypothetical protein
MVSHAVAPPSVTWARENKIPFVNGTRKYAQNIKLLEQAGFPLLTAAQSNTNPQANKEESNMSSNPFTQGTARPQSTSHLEVANPKQKVYLRALHQAPDLSNDGLWKVAGQSTLLAGGKFDPERASSARRQLGITVTRENGIRIVKVDREQFAKTCAALNLYVPTNLRDRYDSASDDADAPSISMRHAIPMPEVVTRPPIKTTPVPAQTSLLTPAPEPIRQEVAPVVAPVVEPVAAPASTPEPEPAPIPAPAPAPAPAPVVAEVAPRVVAQPALKPTTRWPNPDFMDLMGLMREHMTANGIQSLVITPTNVAFKRIEVIEGDLDI